MSTTPDDHPKRKPKRNLTAERDVATNHPLDGRGQEVVGWREWALLPSLASTPIRAKIDTGASSSSVHASKVVMATDPFGRQIASFDLHLSEDRESAISIRSHQVIDTRVVRSSSGHWASRPVIAVPLQLGELTFEIDVTLASRDPMEYRMLIGRSALRKRFYVDTNQSFLLGEPQ